MPTVKVNDQDVTIERFTLAKGVRVVTLLTELQRQVPELTREFAAFRKSYSSDYAVELDRAQALVQYPPTVVYGADDNPMLLADGTVATRPSAVSLLTDQDWERAGQVLRVPAEPSQPEVFMAMAPLVFERAQVPSFRLLALLAMDNDKVSKYAANGTLYERLDEYATETLADADIADIMELVTVAAEVVDTTILAKARTLGKRLRPIKRVLGIADKTATETESPETQSRPPVVVNTVTSTGSHASSDGTPTEPSEPPSTSSATSSTTSSETPKPKPEQPRAKATT